jgi:excisionase family DNA binding protein
MATMLSTKEVAAFLNVNEKMVYTLVAEKGLPATKITGKWMFPRHLVEQWVEMHTINYPKPVQQDVNYQKLLIITGSNDLLLGRIISLFNQQFPEYMAVFGNLGSMGGLRALRQSQCHIAASHLLQENDEQYNFKAVESELPDIPAVVNFCRREQGVLLAKGNPKRIKSIADLGKKGVRIANRALGTGTRLLLDLELKRANLDPQKLQGYQNEQFSHLDIGLEVSSGSADAAPGIRIVAHLLGLDFLPLRWERFDLLIPKDMFFEKGVQLFLGLMHDEKFKSIFPPNSGYNLETSGKVVFPDS